MITACFKTPMLCWILHRKHYDLDTFLLITEAHTLRRVFLYSRLQLTWSVSLPYVSLSPPPPSPEPILLSFCNTFFFSGRRCVIYLIAVNKSGHRQRKGHEIQVWINIFPLSPWCSHFLPFSSTSFGWLFERAGMGKRKCMLPLVSHAVCCTLSQPHPCIHMWLSQSFQ